MGEISLQGTKSDRLKKCPGMVSDETRLELNRKYFAREIDRQRRAYEGDDSSPRARLWRARCACAAATLEKALPPGSRILDVGCGTGELSHRLAKSGFQVSAVDLVAEMIEQASKSSSEVEWINAPFSDNLAPRKSFDAVVSLGYLEYQERSGKELVRMHRLLKPGGLLLLSVPNTLSEQFGFGLRRALFRAGKEPATTPVRHTYTPERLQRQLGMAGFILLDYIWLSSASKEQALAGSRERKFWPHRVRDRLRAEMLTLSRSYHPRDTAP